MSEERIDKWGKPNRRTGQNINGKKVFKNDETSVENGCFEVKLKYIMFAIRMKIKDKNVEIRVLLRKQILVINVSF